METKLPLEEAKKKLIAAFKHKTNVSCGHSIGEDGTISLELRVFVEGTTILDELKSRIDLRQFGGYPVNLRLRSKIPKALGG